jgi:hypothetical protein
MTTSSENISSSALAAHHYLVLEGLRIALRAILPLRIDMLTMLASDELVFNARNFKILNSWPSVKAIADCPVPKNQKDLRKWLRLANYLHKYSENDADMARPLSNLPKRRTGVGTPSVKMLSWRSRRFAFMRRFWRCHTLIVLSVSSVMHRTSP